VGGAGHFPHLLQLFGVIDHRRPTAVRVSSQRWIPASARMETTPASCGRTSRRLACARLGDADDRHRGSSRTPNLEPLTGPAPDAALRSSPAVRPRAWPTTSQPSSILDRLPTQAVDLVRFASDGSLYRLLPRRSQSPTAWRRSGRCSPTAARWVRPPSTLRAGCFPAGERRSRRRCCGWCDLHPHAAWTDGEALGAGDSSVEPKMSSSGRAVQPCRLGSADSVRDRLLGL
jgi:hypothetical protein